MRATSHRPRFRIGAAGRLRWRLIGLLTVLAALTIATIYAVTGTAAFTTAGFTAKISNGTNTVATAPYFKCSDAETADKSTALFQYYLNETSSSTTAADSSGAGNAGTYQGTMATSTTTPIACSRDTGGAYVLNGTSSFVSTPKSYANPTTFSEEVWFKTSSAGGDIAAFGSKQTGADSQYDRLVYVTSAGKISFGTYSGGYQIITSPNAYNDGKWHHVAATMSAATGMRLYLDGILVASNAAYTAPENSTGYWRFGYEATGGWSGAASTFFTGQMRYAAVYSSVLTAGQVSNHFAAGQ